MQNSLRFETPENVQVRYEPAGLGTRFVAWFIDQILLFVCMLLLFIALFAAGASFDFLIDGGRNRGPSKDDHAVFYFFGLIMLIWGLGSFVYYGCFELLMRGQTIGKRASSIRVIKSNGFQLDAGSILVRNVFRVVDHMPPMWLFPIISKIGQRAGDMVAGTLVVFDQPATLTSIRSYLAGRTASDAQFRFDASMLKRLSENDFLAIERVLERVPTLEAHDAAELIEIYTNQIARKLSIDLPPMDRGREFLEDLLAAEIRRQDRALA